MTTKNVTTNTDKNSLNWTHFPAGEHGFFRAPVLITGEHEAILIDAGFTFSDGNTIAEAIKVSGKKLTTIYISQSDPDYYFSLAPIKAAFPDARVIAASATIDAIKKNVDKKLATWGPQLKDNGPQTMADVVMPEVFDGHSLELEGKTIEIVDADGIMNRRYLWVPSINAIFGGVMIFSGVHVWTADTAGAEGRAAWIKNLDAMAEHQPTVVIPGHLALGAASDISAITYTKNYLLAFEEELAKATNSAELINAMTQRYPNLGMGIALQIGAKVATGEMTWG
ncbi:MBL fold metallo-hydrolase [Pectobacterium aquaticum]|uniref:MBL fold metallo-hydrolase n=2 Tax=Pectobacterium aquaticum TaxID=2204145 RepID=A0AA93DPP1_9GAMM|nr:MBL fold metallo-hydrolase [Pectobacterium aquaticum]PLY35913.1 MBL fold metallo-hydrolase [Pectobacterium carotovorum]RRN95635.1 MBL fold metallo-hydrolase [Pectobacterium aquaticum]RRN97812.1 MBL fold metallo-hydrolase [Pectobacterium aquaticum]RRO03032.1 MBL fold metallo-hydrolase [Pectobacterium aquaticum]